MNRSLQTSLVALALAAAGCSGADASSFGNGDGGGGGGATDSSATATGVTSTADSSTGVTSTGVTSTGVTSTATGSQASSGAGGDATSSGSGQGGEGDGGTGGDSSGRCGDDSCDDDESCRNCEEDCGSCDDCGDGVCQDEESCESCDEDCGACVEDCEEHDECNDDEVCIDGACEDALDRNYVFTIVSASFPLNDPGNVPWDPVGAPDGFVDICNSSVCPAGRTNTRQDSYTPSWNETFVHDFEDDGEAVFVLWDEDLDADDFALETPIGSAAEWIDIVRNEGGTYTYESLPGLSLTIEIEPQ